LFTKALPLEKFNKLRDSIGMENVKWLHCYRFGLNQVCKCVHYLFVYFYFFLICVPYWIYFISLSLSWIVFISVTCFYGGTEPYWNLKLRRGVVYSNFNHQFCSVGDTVLISAWGFFGVVE
jgi:hypothetical protein